MALALTLARGAVAGLGKRPSASAPLPEVTLTAAAVRVDPRRAAAYARLCGFRPGGRLPLTYPHVLGFPLAARIMAARAFPLPLMGLVHTAIEIRAHAALTAADRPDLTVHAARLRPHRRGTEVEMVTRARLDGQLVWEDVSTYLARHRVSGEEGTAAGTRGEGDERVAPASPDALAERARWRLDGGLGRRHARVTGDYNPIHLYPWTARPFGFPRTVVHGMWTVARCAAERPEATTLTAAFRRPVLLPSTVVYAAEGPRFEVRSEAGLHVTGTSA